MSPIHIELSAWEEREKRYRSTNRWRIDKIWEIFYVKMITCVEWRLSSSSPPSPPQWYFYHFILHIFFLSRYSLDNTHFDMMIIINNVFLMIPTYCSTWWSSFGLFYRCFWSSSIVSSHVINTPVIARVWCVYTILNSYILYYICSSSSIKLERFT